jgi:hypothetical protein
MAAMSLLDGEIDCTHPREGRSPSWGKKQYLAPRPTVVDLPLLTHTELTRQREPPTEA